MARRIPPDLAHTRARVAAKSRDLRAGVCPESDLADALLDHKAARTEVYIKRVLDEAPPLRDDQRAKLAELLRPARTGGGDNGST